MVCCLCVFVVQKSNSFSSTMCICFIYSCWRENHLRMWNMFHVHSLKPNVPMVYIFSEQRKKEKLSIYVKLFRLYLWQTIWWNSQFGIFVIWRFIQVSSEIMEWHGQTGKHSLFLSIYLSLLLFHPFVRRITFGDPL